MLRISLGILAMASASACAYVDGYPHRPAGFAPEHTAKYFSADEIAKYDLQSNALLGAVTNSDRAIILSNMRILRNSIVEAQISAYDYEFTKFISDLSGLNVLGNVGVDWATLALTGLTATVGGETTKAALGAASTGLIGARSAAQKEIFAEKTIPVLITAMVSERTRVLAVMRTGLSNNVTDYGLYRALSDLEDYYAAGSINGSLIQITEKAGAQTKASKAKIERITDGQADIDDASELLSDFWMPDGQIDDETEQTLINWMNSNDLPTDNSGDIPAFLYYNEFKELREKAVRDLNLDGG